MPPAHGVTLAMSFAAGLLSFASPCVLPIVPSFLGFISGMSFEQMTEADRQGRSAILPYTLAFVAGFSLVFVALGASATAVGGLLSRHQSTFRMVGGALVIVLGLHFMRVINIPFLQTEKRVHLKSKPFGLLGSFLVGVTFAMGWTPCIGPILGSILMVAASQANMAQGIVLLSAYSLGFAIPFLLAAAAINRFLSTYRKFSRYMPVLIRASGAFLVGIGVLLMLNKFAVIAETMTQWMGS
jgi:cytochrome c-type biogenesis protein